jgi:putative transposase
MPYDPDKHHRRSIRIPGYDYGRVGAYFVTICTHQRKCLFGQVSDGEMHLSGIGLIADECWRATPDHFDDVELDAYVIMPNHVHGIVIITTNVSNTVRGTACRAPT